MAITTGLVNSIKQIGADAIAPSASTLKIALIKVGATGTYDQTYASAFATGLAGDECATANGYTQGGIALGTRTAGPSVNIGWVDYADAVWTAVGALSAIGAVIFDSSQANRVVGFIDFAGTKTATDAAFTVQIPGDAGNGLVRIA
jgi:hypothetical protein